MNVRLLLIFLSALAAGVPVGVAPAADEIVVYSGRKEMVIKPVTEAFQTKTGVPVKLKIGKTSGLAHELIQEKARPRADVFIATEAGVMDVLAKNGVLDAYVSPEAKDLDLGFRDREGRWTGISSRARVILYNKKLVAEKDVPRIDGAYEIPLKPDIIDPVPLTGFRRTPVTEAQLADLAESTLTLLAGIGPEW